MSVGRLRVTVRARCAVCVRWEGVPAAVWCAISYDMCIASSFVRWLFGGCMVGLSAVLFVPLLLSFKAIPGLCRFLRVTHELHALCLHSLE